MRWLGPKPTLTPWFALTKSFRRYLHIYPGRKGSARDILQLV